MKFILFLVPCLVLCTAEEPDWFGKFEQQMSEYVKWLKNMVRSDILNEDGTDFDSSIAVMLAIAESHIICPVEAETCVPSENLLIGCNCRKGFQALGECKKKPCELFKHFRDNGVNSLNSFLNADSYEDMYKIIFSDFINPITRAVCECRGMIGALMNCVENYDGQLFSILGKDRSTFDVIVDHLDWNTIQLVLDGIVDPVCADGTDCVTEIPKMHKLSGTMLDNTFNKSVGEDACLSMRRFKDKFFEYMKVVESFDPESESWQSMVTRFVDAWYSMEKAVMCDPNCAEELRDAFYSCCSKHALESWSSISMKENYQKLFKNVWPLVAEGNAPNISKAMEKYFSIWDVESFCLPETDVYKVKGEQCELIEA